MEIQEIILQIKILSAVVHTGRYLDDPEIARWPWESTRSSLKGMIVNDAYLMCTGAVQKLFQTFLMWQGW